MRIGPGVALTLLLALSPAGARADPRAVFVGSYVWHDTRPGFGGFSGLEMSDDGSRFVALSDSASLVTGTLTRNAEGAVTAVTASAPVRLRDKTGAPLVNPFDDAEGLAFARDGTVFISFELVHRVQRYTLDGRLVGGSGAIPGAEDFQLNGGFEALAADARGRLYALPEEVPSGRSDLPVYRRDRTGWREVFSLGAAGSWRPVGMDAGPDGRLYMLERAYLPLVGFRSRISRLTLDGDVPVRWEVLAETHARRFDNLEGLAVWRAADGGLRLTMVSDNNFLPIQQTELVDYRIVE